MDSVTLSNGIKVYSLARDAGLIEFVKDEKFNKLYNKFNKKDHWGLQYLINQKKAELDHWHAKNKNLETTHEDVETYYQENNKKIVFNMFESFRTALNEKNIQHIKQYLTLKNKFYVKCFEILTDKKFNYTSDIQAFINSLTDES